MNILACLVKFILACGGLLGAATALGLGVTATLDAKLRVPFYLGAVMALAVVLFSVSALLWLLTALEKPSVRTPPRRRPARATRLAANLQ